MKSSHCRKLLQHGATLQGTIEPSLNGTSEANHKQLSDYKPLQTHFDSSMALTVLVVFIALFFVAFLSMYFRRFSDNGSSATSVEIRGRMTRYMISSRSDASKGLSLETRRSLPLVPYHVGAAGPGNGDCVICLSEFEEGEMVKMIPNCRHMFHPECVDMWLASHVSCPLCRSTKMFRDA